MSEKKTFKCDVCRKKITKGHQQYYMAKVTIDHTIQIDDGSPAGTDSQTDIYHIHNDFSNHCLGNLWNILEKDRK